MAYANIAETESNEIRKPNPTLKRDFATAWLRPLALR